MMIKNIFITKTIAEIQEELVSGELDLFMICELCIKQVERFNSKFKAWVCFDSDIIYKQTEALALKMEKNGCKGLLTGIPIGVKDIMNTTEFPTQMGSPLWENFTPGNDARIIYYLKNAGGIIPGKTVTAEFAVHTLNENSTLNPHAITRTPGTSSSGSAIAVALGMVPVALGTQTAASIVRPASFCGVYGCKPSFGLLPRTGMLKTTDSLDTVGFFTYHVNDIERVFNVLRVHGPNFPFSYEALKDKTRQNKPNNRPWRIALVKTHTWEFAEDYAKNSLLDWAQTIGKDNNIDVNEVDLPYKMETSHDIHATIYNKTLSYYFKKEFKKSELVSPIMNDLIRDGNNISVEQYYKALKNQNELIHLMDNFFSSYDILISLSTAGEAPLRGEVEKKDTALMWTLAHLPVVSAPVFKSPSNLPFGVQIVARKYNDLLLFDFIQYMAEKNFMPRTGNPILYI